MTRILPDSRSSAASPSASAAASRGRKAEQIFAAAEVIFLESGYSAASMDAVAARAGVSKATIYVHFANKRALFEAIIRRRAERVFGRLEFSETVSDPRQALTDVARLYTGMLQGADSLAMYRVVLAEARQQPDVGEAFYLAGPAYARRRVGEFFTALAARGLLSFVGIDALVVADLFLSMLAGDCHLRALFGQPNDSARVEAVIAGAVGMVMARCAA
jgi:TetR/AcrR family transcriptional repressor of mexJK operon